MQLTVLGSSPAFPNPGGACSGYILQSDGSQILLECGHGVSGKLGVVTELQELSGIVISHMHPDHYFDLVPLSYGFTFSDLPKVPLFVPPGGQAILHRLQSAVRLSEGFFEHTFLIHEYAPEEPLNIGTIQFEFGLTKHFVDAYAMRITSCESDAGILAYSSDTGWEDSLLPLFQGASVGLFEATLAGEVDESGKSGHLTATQAGKLARDSGIQRLLMTHYWRQKVDELCREAAAAFDGPVDLAEEGESYEIIRAAA